MLRSMLAERFQLKVHRETKELSGYALSVAKDGPRLKAPEDTGWRLRLMSIIRTPSDRGLYGL
jgi:uncharacterized protein (TIGR03435 family)